MPFRLPSKSASAFYWDCVAGLDKNNWLHADLHIVHKSFQSMMGKYHPNVVSLGHVSRELSKRRLSSKQTSKVLEEDAPNIEPPALPVLQAVDPPLLPEQADHHDCSRWGTSKQWCCPGPKWQGCPASTNSACSWAGCLGRVLGSRRCGGNQWHIVEWQHVIYSQASIVKPEFPDSKG